MDRESDNLILGFFWKIYVQVCFFVRYWFYVFTKDNQNDARSQRKTINSLFENFASEDIKLINPNESVEDTFMRKINEKDYESAMKLAKKFDFDMDLIYKSMWENNDIDVKLIEDCLTKVSKTDWILKECVDCIPRRLDALKQLLKFGIEISSKESLMSFTVDPQSSEPSENNLTVDGKRFVQHRQNLISYLRRLNLYEQILQRQHQADYAQHFDSNYYAEFRKKSIFQLAINFAQKADHDSLAVLFKHESHILSKHFLVIISNLPETVSPTKYKDLLNILFDMESSDLESRPTKATPTDWSAEYATLFQAQQDSQFESTFFIDNSNYRHYVTELGVNRENLTSWLRDRALEIFDYTSLVDNSLQLLLIGIENGLRLEQLYTELDLYSLLLYENDQSDMAFEQFEKLSLPAKMNLILSKHDPIMVIENVFDKFIQKLGQFKQAAQVNVDKKELLREFMVNLAKTNFAQCLAVFENYSMADKTVEQIRAFKLINDAYDLIELAIDCIHAYENPASLEMAFRVMECLPERSQGDILVGTDAAKLRQFSRINDKADQLAEYLSIIEVFDGFNTHITVKDLDAIVGNKSAQNARLFFDKVVTNFCTTPFGQADISLEWKNFLWHLQDFRKDCLDIISSEELIEMCVQNMLLSSNKVLIKLAMNHICLNPTKVSPKKLSYEKGKQMLKKAANDYIKFASPNQDENIELAKVCLEVFKDHPDVDEDILDELDLIEGLMIMNADFAFDMLPIKVKQSAQPRIDLIEKVLKSSKKAYTKISTVLRLSELLRVCKDYPEDQREGTVLSMIGKEALETEDYQAAHQVCEIILERNLQHAWDLCYLFAKLPNLTETVHVTQQLAFLSFALAYCPETDVDAHFNILNEIKSIKASTKNPNTFIEFKGQVSVK